jgi:predicted alpha/beta hydrolase family esterase
VRLLARTLLASAAVLVVCPSPAEAAAQTCQGLTATIVGTDGNDQLRGTPGDDVIVGLAGNDVIRGEGGNDVICGGPGNDTLFGDAGDDTMLGGDDNDVLHGADGNDTLDGGTGKNNVLQGGDGWDVCTNGKPHHCEDLGGNRVPVANAGPDQTVASGGAVSLDGSISSDADGDRLTFRWSFASAPVGSNPILSDPTAVRPTFIADSPGEYVVRLIVNDGQFDSAPDTVVIATGNSAPIANAGLDRTALVGTSVTLDGSASTDSNGDPLTFHWSILSAPEGSSAPLSDPAAVSPSLLIDAPGIYLIQLIVDDGEWASEPDAMVISTVNSPPTAHAGADQTARVGDTVGLDGSGSSDVDGNPLTFRWSLSAVPLGSTASIDNQSAMNPSFTIDQFGTYIAQLIVNDGTVDSEPDFVVINIENSAPVANAGFDQETFVGMTVTLDGTGSDDADANALTYRWSFTSRPTGSEATLSDSSAPTPTFAADVRGSYVAQLIVNDGTVDSAPDTVVISTGNRAPVADAGPDLAAFVAEPLNLSCATSTDPDGDSYACAWTLVSVPSGSSAALSDPASTTPAFTPDVRGVYEFALVVTDDGGLASTSDSVLVTTQNRPPAADAGADQTPFIGQLVSLSCLASTDPDGDPYTCAWTLVSAPSGSAAALSDPASTTPLFTPDVRGVYEFALVVTDDVGLASTSDHVLVTTQNRAPVADAGADQTPFIGEVVALSCLASTDPDGDPYACAWTLVSAPSGSTAALSDPASTTPVFTPDVRGVYEFALVVTDDGGLASTSDSVLVTTQNRPPAADAGADQAPFIGQLVSLSCLASTDPDGDPVTCQWTITSAPPGSSAALSDASSTTPTFTPDVRGTYEVVLVVTDDLGLSSTADSVLVSTLNRAPLADAGADQTPLIRETVMLSCTASTDPDRDPYTCQWSLLSAPAGSVAALSDATSKTPTFTPDVRGVYEFALVTTDDLGAASATDTVLVATINRAPIANAGADQAADIPATVALNGGGSSDPDLDSLIFQWSIATAPDGSTAALVNPTSMTPTFTPDVAGIYVFSVIVSDGLLQSVDTITLTVRPPRIRITLVGTPFLGVGRIAQAQVELPVPAPAGGVTVTVTSDDTAILEPVMPGTVFIEAGQVTGLVSVAGVAPGDALLRANAPGFDDGTATMTVTNKVVELPPSFSVPLGQQAALTVSIGPDPAPAGGVTIQLTTSDENIIAVSAFVTILPGEFSANALVTGVRPGTAIVTATNPDFATDSTPVSTAVQLNIVETSASFSAGLIPPNITVRLQTSGLVVPAPAPGVEVTLTSANPDCATAPSFSLPTGLSTVVVAVSYGGTTALPCTTTLTASSPGVTSDAVTITVNPQLGMTFNGFPATVGAGMHSTGTRWVRLGASNHGGTTIRIESANPALVLVSPNATTVGTPFIEVQVPNGENDLVFVAHGLEGVTGTATINVTANKFNGASTSVAVAQPAARLNGVATAVTVFQPPDVVNVQIGVPAATGANLAEVQSIRPGGTPVSIIVTSSSPAVAGFVSGATTTDSVTLQINPGQSITPNVSLKPLGAGTTTLSVATPAGYTTVATATAGVTVTGPGITFNGYPTTVGSGMTSTGTRWVRLGATNHGGTTVRIESKHPERVLISRTASTIGQPFIEVDLADGERDVIFVAHGLEGVTGAATIEVTSAGFTTASTSVAVAQPAARLNGVATALTVFTTPDPFNVSIGPAAATGANLLEVQNIRPGGTAVNVTVTTSQPSIAAFVSGTTTANSQTVTINPGQSTSANMVLKPLTEGDATIRAITPSGFATVATGTVNVIVSTPGITFSGFPTTVGAGLMSTGTRWVRLGATNHGGIRVRIESSNPLLALVSPNATTAGAAFIEVDLPDGERDAIFQVHGMEGVSGNVVITVSAPGFSDANTTASIQPAAIKLSGLLTTAVAGGAVDAFIVQIGLANATGTDLAGTQSVRPGGPGMFITITSSNPAAGRIFTSTEEGAGVTVQILAGQSQAAASFRPVAPGPSQVKAVATDGSVIETTAATVTVTVQ